MLSCNDLLTESFNINTVICKMMKYIYTGKYVWKTKGGILTLNFRTQFIFNIHMKSENIMG